MNSIIGALILLLFGTKSYGGVTAIRQQLETAPDFFLEEAILSSLVNSVSSILDNRPPLPSLFDPIFPVIVPEKDILFYLYTRGNPIEAVTLKVGDVSNLNNSTFNNRIPTKILIHGWTDSATTPWVNDFRKNYLQVSDFNVIIVDWSAISNKEYLKASKLAKQVADYVSQLLDFLVSEKYYTLDRVHILGHSLGAHIAGFVGYNKLGKVARITGMDPARPDYEAPIIREAKDRLDKSDAQFVDVIHTCAGTAGFVRPIGHADFYPNGGTFRQPGCPVFMTQYCSHGRAHQFVSESIINPTAFPAIKCTSWRDFKSNKCDKSKNQIVYMGEKLSPDTRGIYFLETNLKSPFGKEEL